MFRIGEFARLGQVSVKTLHHYHRIGLLVPTAVDPTTGYRLYAAEQLADLNRVLAMRDFGFTLGEISAWLEGGAGDVVTALSERRRVIEEEIAELRGRQRSIDARLAIADRGLTTDLVVRRLPARLVASIRSPYPAGGDVSALFVELEEHVLAHRARAPLPPLMLYHDWVDGLLGDIEVVVPVVAEVPTTASIHVWWLPAVDRALCFAHRGPYEQLGRLRAVYAGWLSDHPDEPVAPLRELFIRFAAEPHLTLPAQYLTDTAQQLVTEYQLPLGPPSSN